MEVENIFMYVAPRLKNVIIAEVMKVSKREEHVKILVLHKGKKVGTMKMYNPLDIGHTRLGYRSMRKIIINRQIEKLRSYVDGL